LRRYLRQARCIRGLAVAEVEEMKRAVLGLGLGAMFALAPIAAGTAAAAPPLKTTVVLTCDKNVSARAALTLLDGVGGTQLGTLTTADLSCGDFSPTGRSRVRVVVPEVAAAAVLVTQYDAAVPNSVPIDCSSNGTAGGTLPADFVCAPSGGMTTTLSLK
jgi:hypothetical protein